MRPYLFVVLAVLPLGCSNRRMPGDGGDSSTGTIDTRQGYAQARAAFRTKLVRRGPSPEPASALHFSKLGLPPNVEQVEFPSGGLRLVGWTQTPLAKKPLMPAVVFLHGGWGFDEGDWERAEGFREAGYVVLAPMLRGENGCPGAFTMFYDEVDDVLAAGKFLAGRPYVDPNRVYLAGYSAGGTLTMLAAMTTDRFRAAAALDGSPNRRDFVRGREDEVPFDVSDPDEFRLRSPGAFPASFKCPVRLYCSSDVGGYTEVTRRLAASAKEAGRDVEMVPVPGDHGTFREPATKLAIEFFGTK